MRYLRMSVNKKNYGEVREIFCSKKVDIFKKKDIEESQVIFTLLF